jgi:geranylgeranyl pyrophosphate synthase
MLTADGPPDGGGVSIPGLLTAKGSIAYTLAIAGRLVSSACDALAPLPIIPARDRLEAIARHVPRRDH